MARAIHTFTTPQELIALYQLAEQCGEDGRVLEVGSYLGASTCYLAAGLRGDNAMIYCVDTWQNQTMPDGVRDTMKEFSHNTAGVKSRIVTLRKNSGEVLLSEVTGPFDLVFLDGDHSYAQTKDDFVKFGPLVKDDGILAFHDSFYYQGVSQVIGDALRTGEWQLAGNTENLTWLRKSGFANPA